MVRGADFDFNTYMPLYFITDMTVIVNLDILDKGVKILLTAACPIHVSMVPHVVMLSETISVIVCLVTKELTVRLI